MVLYCSNCGPSKSVFAYTLRRGTALCWNCNKAELEKEQAALQPKTMQQKISEDMQAVEAQRRMPMENVDVPNR